MGFIQNINKLANELDSKVEEINQILETITQNKTEIDNAKTEAINASSLAQSNATLIQNQLNREATNTQLGSVMLAENNDYNIGNNKVITAILLKSILSNINESLDTANTIKKGLVKIATNEEVKNKTGNNVITTENLAYYPFSIDMTNFFNYSTISGINYITLNINSTTQVLLGFGKISTNANELLKLIFPKDINTSSLGIGTSLFGSNNNNNIIINDLTSKYVTLSIRNNNSDLVNSKGFIIILAMIDVNTETNSPTDVEANVEGNKVTLTWDE